MPRVLFPALRELESSVAHHMVRIKLWVKFVNIS